MKYWFYSYSTPSNQCNDICKSKEEFPFSFVIIEAAKTWGINKNRVIINFFTEISEKQYMDLNNLYGEN